uniref:Serpentine receptor class gamma n=1 Tax=Caenorhabditis japonica TaxID=281687 RepID=A0A8R1DYN4_CAEJA
MEDSIHGVREYMDFHYVFTFSTIVAIVPFTYMLPTVFVMLRICQTFIKSKRPSMDRHLFVLIAINFFCICPKIMHLAIPLLIIIPSGSTSFMLPAVGYCRTMGPPLRYGAIYLYYSGGWSGVVYLYYTDYVYYLMLFRPFGNDVETVMMPWILRLTHPMFNGRENGSITSTASTVFTKNIVVYLYYTDYVYYLMLFRPFGNDVETVMMPWILRLTHPMFNGQENGSITSTASTVFTKNIVIL